YFDHKVDKQIKEKMEQVNKGICIANDATYEFVYEDGYPPVVNHEEETDIVFQTAENITEIQSATISEAQMTGEDFAHYLEEIPGAIFSTVANNEGHDDPHLHPMFDFNEKAMPIAAKMLIGAYMEYQASK